MSYTQNRAREAVTRLFAESKIVVDGNRKHDITVNDDRFFVRVLAGGSLALGESYMEGWWDCENLDAFFGRIIAGGLEKRSAKQVRLLFDYALALIHNRQSVDKAPAHIQAHYDFPVEVFEAMLGPSMTYTGALWKDATTLEEAQDAKHELICKKLNLESGMTVLDIGCGWGPLMQYVDRQELGVRVSGLTISRRQFDYLDRTLGSRSRHNIALCDYRTFEGVYDRVLSVEMFEHVGQRNHRAYMKAVHGFLPRRNSLHLMQVITTPMSFRASRTDPWLDKHIFPGSQLPSMAQILKASEGLFNLEHIEGFGLEYHPTLMAWWQNYDKAWKQLGHDMVTRRMMKYYLHFCAALFRTGRIQVSQVVFSKGAPKTYSTAA